MSDIQLHLSRWQINLIISSLSADTAELLFRSKQVSHEASVVYLRKADESMTLARQLLNTVTK